MPNPLAIDAHAHICTEETMKLLNKETPKVASSLKEIGQLEDEGITWATVTFPANDRRSYVEALQRFAERVIA